MKNKIINNMFIDIKMPSCCVPGCKINKKKNKAIYMASFPNNVERKKLWMNNIGITNLKSKYLVVCEVSYIFILFLL